MYITLFFPSLPPCLSPKRVKELRDSKRLTQDLEEAELATKNEGSIDATHERNIVVTQEVNHRSGASSPSLSIGEIPLKIFAVWWGEGGEIGRRHGSSIYYMYVCML